MEKASFQWQLSEEKTQQGKTRYCPHCKEKVLFRDSGKRRNNANGKNIYSFAIYKCPADHTWNKRLGYTRTCDQTGASQQPSPPQKMDLTSLWNEGITCVEVKLAKVSGKPRLDKSLTKRIAGISRNQIQQRIQEGAIRVDGCLVKSNTILHSDQIITIIRPAIVGS